MANFAWSYSRVQLHETCAYQYLEKVLRKNPLFDIPEDETPLPLLNGRKVHGGIAAYLTGGPDGTYYADQEKKTYHANDRFAAKKYDKFAAIIDTIRANQPLVEQQWGYDRNYRPTSWFGKDTYYRSILDAGVLWPDNTFSNADWKTGRPKEDHVEQMETQAIAVFARYPQVHWVETRLFYVDTGQEKHDEFLRKDLAALIAKWDKRAGAVENDTNFTARPGAHCRYCPLAKSKGGPCAFS